MRHNKLFGIVRGGAVLSALILGACTGVPAGPAAQPEAVQPARQVVQQLDVQQASAGMPSLFDTTTLQLGEVLLNGKITEISSGKLMIGQMALRTDGQTSLPAGLRVGDRVEVLAIILPDDSHYAVEVVSASSLAFASSSSSADGVSSSDDASSKTPVPGTNLSMSEEGEFKLYGIVQSVNGNQIMVSDQLMQVDPAFLTGIAVGSIVEVEGYLVNGVLQIKEIHLEDNLHNGEDSNDDRGSDDSDDSDSDDSLDDNSSGGSGSDDGPGHDANDDRGGDSDDQDDSGSGSDDSDDSDDSSDDNSGSGGGDDNSGSGGSDDD